MRNTARLVSLLNPATAILAILLLLSACGTRQVPNTARAQARQPSVQASADASHPSSESIVGAGSEDEINSQEEDDGEAGDAEIEDSEEVLPPRAHLEPHPLEGLTEDEIEAMVLHTPEQLGPASIGKPSGGALWNGVPMPESEEEMWNIVNARETFGSQETVDGLARTIRQVNREFPDTPAINIGDISDEDGGHLVPHASHQSGRDVDIGFYYLGGSAWYSKATAKNLDIPRTWSLIRNTIIETDIEVIFLDRTLIRRFREYAEELGEDPHWLDQIFGGPTSNLRPILIHAKGHKTHLHFRYYNPIAQETGRRVYPILLRNKMIQPPAYFKSYKVKRGDTLKKIARKYRTKVSVLKKANRLKSSRIYAGRTYKIPQRGGVVQPTSINIPARRLPPELLPPSSKLLPQEQP